MLIFPLKKEWYEKIKSGEKTVEYREYKSYWHARLFSIYKYFQTLDNTNKTCYFQLGYKPETRIEAFITKIEIIDGQNTDLKIDKPVYAIHFRLDDKKLSS